MDVRPKFVDTNQTLTSGQVKEILKIFEQLIRKHPLKKASKLKEFFKNFLSLIHDRDVVAKLTTLKEETPKDP